MAEKGRCLDCLVALHRLLASAGDFEVSVEERNVDWAMSDLGYMDRAVEGLKGCIDASLREDFKRRVREASDNVREGDWEDARRLVGQLRGLAVEYAFPDVISVCSLELKKRGEA